MTSNPKIAIIGMGPCGLGAAWRLEELGYQNFLVFERNNYAGGLASSFIDEKGFTWDIGGHVQFSHYPYYDAVLDQVMGGDWLYHERSAWIWIRNRFVPYPFQNNIRYLDEHDIARCLQGLYSRQTEVEPKNFEEWILAVFGKGIAEIFMIPYNNKVWAYDLQKLSYQWISERVATPDLKRIEENVRLKRDDFSWGPNNKFRFPLSGGTGEIWKRVSQKLDARRLIFNSDLQKIDTSSKTILFHNGRSENYDCLVSTIPLNVLLKLSDLNVQAAADSFVHSATHIIGVGLEGKPAEHLTHKSWLYFPEPDVPFYRVTVFSNYSPRNVPDPNRYWSLMAEVSESPEKRLDRNRIINDVVAGLRTAKLIGTEDKIVDSWQHFVPYGYPTPFLQRDSSLQITEELEKRSIFSRGRFGAWKYEVSNQDHSFMQGVEVVNRIVLNQEETTVKKIC